MCKKESIRNTSIDKLNIDVYRNPESLGRAASAYVEEKVLAVMKQRNHANLLMATGASQFDFLKILKQAESLDWSNITIFHLDEYIGLSENHSASFRKYLHVRIIDEVEPGEAYFLRGDADDIQEEIVRYEKLLEKHPIDVACIGIGENGHLAFNDPPVADFNDPDMVKVVELDQKSRQQQVDEGWFNTIEDVPEQALSLTIPAIMASDTISCVVPDRRKAEAVYKTLHGPISTETPASILRTHQDATLFLDTHSAQKLE